MIRCDFSYAHTRPDEPALADRVAHIHEWLHNPETEMAGWVQLPFECTEAQLDAIQAAADAVCKECDAFVICGIGGSFLGTKAGLDLLLSPFKGNEGRPEILFAGQHLSSSYHQDLFQHLENRDFTLCVVSKSGTTMETVVMFSMLRELLKSHYGARYAEHIIVITDEGDGHLYREALAGGYRLFTLPPNIGGRYSVLTAVGLFPFAVAGLDIYAMIDGARAAAERYNTPELADNECYRYASARHQLAEKGYEMEVFEVYEGQMRYFTEWLRQLFAESECKNGRGLFPVAMQMSTDLHSLGQFLQDGRQNFIETVLAVDRFASYLEIPEGVAGSCERLDCLNRIIQSGVREAHQKNKTPIITLNVSSLSAASFGELVYFFEKACAMSAALSGTNPFDQPGVEAYKAHVRAAIESHDEVLL